MAVEIIGNLVKIEFNNSVLPIFTEKKSKEYVLFGENNNYPSFIIDLYNKHPEHSAILKTKCRYISGKGLTVDTDYYSNVMDAVRAESFLTMANRYEDWDSVYKKTVNSLEIFNGWYWQIIWNLAGTRCEVYLLQFAKCRVSKCGKKILYSDNWVNADGTPIHNPEYVEYDIFNHNVRKGTQVYFYKVTDQYYDGIGDTYPLPEYKGAMINIYTDIAVSEFQNNLALHGMTAQGMLTLFRGEPTTEEKKKLDRLFNNKFTGVAGSKVILNFAADGGDKGAEWTTFQTSDLDKQFELISKVNQQKIITGHQIPNKGLVGISTEGALSDRTSIDLGYEQLQNTYVIPRQELILEEIEMIGEICGTELELKVTQLKPINIDFMNPSIQKYLTEDEIRDYLGLESKQATQEGQPQGPVNENLRGLTGKEWIHIKRLIREVKSGKTSKEAAALMIRSGYGLSDQDINVLFGEGGEQIAQFNEVKKVDDIIKMFEMAAIDDNDDEVIETSYKFKEDLENKVLDILKGDPTISPEKLAVMLNEDVEKINEVLIALITAGLILSNYQPTQKGLEKKTKAPDVEVYTVYKYVTRDDVRAAKSGSRPFCEKMLALTTAGKVWTRSALDSLTNEMGEDAWTYRGGFYNNPKTGEIEPYCRHIWQSVVKTKRR